MNLSIDIQPTWWARVTVTHGATSFTRKCEAPAKTPEQAQERMAAALAVVWPGWEVCFDTQPQEKKI